MKKRKKERKRKRSFKLSFQGWRHIKLGLKYVIAFSITIALFLTATVIVYTQLDKAKGDVNSIIEQSEFSNDLAQIALLIERKDSFVSNYILQNNNAIVDDYTRISEELSDLLEKVQPQFKSDKREVELERIKENNDDIDDLFLNVITNKDIGYDEHIRAQISVDTRKISSVSLLNRLIIEVSEKQTNMVSNTNESLSRNTVYLAIANILALIIGTIVVVVISRSISNNLHKVVTMTSKLAQGDLTVPRVTYEGRDEIGQLASSVNALRESMYSVLSEVTNASHHVTNRSESLTQSAKDVQLGSEQVVLTMDELAAGAESQATGATHLSESMQQFVNTIINSQQEGQKIVRESEEVLLLTTEGSDLMTQSVAQMEKIDVIMADAVEKVQGLDQQSGEISHLVSIVKEIADQTNLLSLNAAIEAARAGEHGRGFAVVADEVGKLADEVANSVSEITNIVHTIQSETNTVVTSLNDGYSEVEEGIAQIERTGERFKTIDSSVSEMVSQISNIASQLNHVAKSSETMNKLIEDIAAVSEEAAAGVEQSAASVQESTSAMDEVARNASELEDLAQKLHKEIEKFTL